ncbi:MAG: SDR family NAD(P)-dependent oxidoreductase, partial [Fidelibacterota bacterium]
GVTVVGVARSREGLDATREDIENEGGTCHAVPFDLTEIDRLPYLLSVVRSLAGEVDILVNNAAVEVYKYYQDNGPEDLLSILTLNLHVPMELTRLVLPSMLERGGHIVTIASLAGTTGGSSVVCPGYVREVGMFADSRVKVPPLLGTSSPGAVARAVLEAVRGEKPEIIVNRGPIKPLLAFGQVAPLLADKIVRWLGVAELNRKRVEAVKES